MADWNISNFNTFEWILLIILFILLIILFVTLFCAIKYYFVYRNLSQQRSQMEYKTYAFRLLDFDILWSTKNNAFSVEKVSRLESNEQ